MSTTTVERINPTELDMVLDARDYLLANGGTEAELARNAELIVRYSRGTWYAEGPTEPARRRGRADTIESTTSLTPNTGDTGDTHDFGPAVEPVRVSRDRRGPSPDAVRFATSLVGQVYATAEPRFTNALVDAFPTLLPRQLSRVIDRLLDLKKQKQAASGWTSLADFDASLPRVRPGRYKVDGRLYKVDQPEAGQWAGRCFVTELDTDGDEIGRVRDREAKKAVVTAIAADVLGCMIAFGKETGTCGECGRHLEDPESVANGIGPKCEEKITGVPRKRKSKARGGRRTKASQPVAV